MCFEISEDLTYARKYSRIRSTPTVGRNKGTLFWEACQNIPDIMLKKIQLTIKYSHRSLNDEAHFEKSFIRQSHVIKALGCLC